MVKIPLKRPKGSKNWKEVLAQGKGGMDIFSIFVNVLPLLANQNLNPKRAAS